MVPGLTEATTFDGAIGNKEYRLAGKGGGEERW
jgi:hypothetical protein